MGALLGARQLLVLLLETPDYLQVSQPGGDLSLGIEVRGLARKLLLLRPGKGE